METIVLYDYWRSSASYRVRIALNLKGVAWQASPVDLVAAAHRDHAFRALNPQRLVPALAIDGQLLTQSLAIIDYLDSRFPTPRLIAADPLARARAMAQAQLIIADIHPLNNLRVLHYLRQEMGQDQAAVDRWYRHWVTEGFTALEAMAPDHGLFGGDAPNLADVCLVPQMVNALRFETPMAAFPKLVRIDAALRKLEAFTRAAPEAVKPE